MVEVVWMVGVVEVVGADRVVEVIRVVEVVGVVGVILLQCSGNSLYFSGNSKNRAGEALFFFFLTK